MLYCILLLLISRKEKEKLVIKLATEGKTTMEIAKQVHISLKDIGKIINKVTGDYLDGPTKEEEEKEKQKRIKSLSVYAKAFQMFKDRTSLADVTIELDIETGVVLYFHSDYLRLERMNGLVDLYQELKDLSTFLSSLWANKKRGFEQTGYYRFIAKPAKTCRYGKKSEPL